MNKQLLIKFLLLICFLSGQSFFININVQRNAVQKKEIKSTHSSSISTLRRLNGINILTEYKSDSKIAFDIVCSGSNEEILSVIKEFNANKFIRKINNLKIEKSGTGWILSASVEFSSYIEYTYNR